MLDLNKINKVIADIQSELPVQPAPAKVKPKAKLNKITKALMGFSDDFTDETANDVRSALVVIPSDDRDTWVAVGQALSTIPNKELGFKLFIEFSKKSDKYNEADTRAKWASFTGERTSVKAIFAKAQELGWINPKSKGETGKQDNPFTHSDKNSKTNWQKSEPEQPQKLKKEPLKKLTVRDLLNFKQVDWLIKGLLPSRGIGALYGAPSSGKTFLALDMLAALVRGIIWHGFKIRKKHSVVYLALEGGSGIRNRIAAYLKHNSLKDLEGFYIIMDDFDIRTDFGELIDLIKDINPSLVCIDTLNQSMPGADENSGADMSLITSRAKIIADAIEGLVLFVHHLGKDASKGMRGHSSLNGNVDIAILVETETVKNPKFFKVTKAKEATSGIPQAFKLKVVELGNDSDGDAITSCIVESDSSEIFNKEPVGKNQIAAYQLLKPQLPMPLIDAEILVAGTLNGNRTRLRAEEAIAGLVLKGFFMLVNDQLTRP
jgi:AAA domain/Primase C terminal 2 (PriCT-2)